LENGRGVDNEMSRGVWKEIENRKTDKARMVEAEEERKKKEEKKKEYRRPTTEEEIAIARIVEKKKEERDGEKDLIELRTVEEIVPRQFYKYLKVFEKKESERIPMRKT